MDWNTGYVRTHLRSHLIKQLELVSHWDIQTLENNEQKHSVFGIVYSCLYISMEHSLSFFK